MAVTIRDIARQLALSHTTVSRVLSDRADVRIRTATRQRVLAAAREMGYRPNRAARALANGRTHLVTAVMNGVRSSFYGHVLDHLRPRVQQDGFALIISPDRVPEHPFDAWFSDWLSDGVLAVDPFYDPAELRQGRRTAQTPCVSMGSTCLDRGDRVRVDLPGGIREAVTHLLDIGCRRIAYVVSADTPLETDSRHLAYAGVMREAHRAPEYIPISMETRAGARAAVAARFAAGDAPDGLFCFNDDIALGAYRGLCDMGLRVPDDVALVGCDGIDDTLYLERPLSTIVLPVEEMCALAWQFLKRRMEDPSAPPQQATLAAHLAIRASSRRAGPPRQEGGE